ncbi:YaeQ family protein [Candidatus Sulfurimonas marisnigri]|uniref:YaeQ family protein n=1 Tax=Candidatus Sulfurimonas marisnigri TaxID=2740405 RepID=A0A7S7RQG8_9BACT|nr:YaeQ family protein [Candidatus Sulfurimonas marisnigri]QOY54538.1 YaeQ family protein [Candidatus Sulfurimonas marisnigri]
MAAKATIHKAALNIADMDRNYYAEHNFTLAKHPSENDLRLMVRLSAFVLNANETLVFCKGISQDDEPDLWEKSLDGEIKLWIDLGQPDEKRIKKACGRSDKVIIYTYQDGAASAWWKQAEKSLKRFKNLSVIYLSIDGDIEELAIRAISLQCNISDGELSLIDEENSVIIRQERWKEA